MAVFGCFYGSFDFGETCSFETDACHPKTPLVKGLGLLSYLFAQLRFGVKLLCPLPQMLSFRQPNLSLQTAIAHVAEVW